MKGGVRRGVCCLFCQQNEQQGVGQVAGGRGQRVSNGKLKAQPNSSLKRSSYDEDR